jgi:hypothetical protein
MAKKMNVFEQRESFILGCKTINEARKEYCKDFNVIGIDPARSSTGFSIGKHPDKFKTGAIVPKYEGFSKVIYVEKMVRQILDKTKSNSFIGIEGYAHNAKWGREAAGELGGVLRRLFYYKHRPLIVIAPTTIKAWIRANKKSNIMLEILDKYKVKISNEDAADAYLISRITYSVLRLAKVVTDSNIKIPEEVRIFLKERECDQDSFFKKMPKYQIESLFRLISTQGQNVLFFQKIFKALKS